MNQTVILRYDSQAELDQDQPTSACHSVILSAVKDLAVGLLRPFVPE